MRATILQLGSFVFAAVGLAAIGVSLLSFSPDLLADEPVTGSCAIPMVCDADTEYVDCGNGGCESNQLPCSGCCKCLEDPEEETYYCQYNGQGGCY
jgi:hypothetical protein